jgi:hypothetical protein
LLDRVAWFDLECDHFHQNLEENLHGADLALWDLMNCVISEVTA